MKIYTNEIDLAKPILKKFYTAPCSDYKFGVKIVQGTNYVIELDGVELESDGETGGYATYKMTSPNEQGTELFKIICENGQVVYIKHVTTDSTVFDVDEGEGGSVEVPTKTSELVNDSDFATNASVDEKIGVVTSSIPTKTSQLENDSNFATNTDLDTVNRNLTTTVTEIQNELNNKATTEYVDSQIGNVLTQEEF